MAKINPWLEKKLKEKNLGPEMLPLLVEVEPAAIEEVKKGLRVIPSVSIGRQAFSFIEISAPVEAMAQIEAVPGVTMVHKSMVKRTLGGPLSILPQLRTLLPKLSLIDPLEGEVKIDNIICPRERLGFDMILPFSPLRFARHHGVLGDVEIIPTSRSRTVVLDIPTVLTGRGVTVAVLDTGWAPLISIARGKAYSTCSTDPHPIDGHGHGSWCCSCAVGSKDSAPLGICLGVAPEAKLISVKVLHGIFGFGMTMDIIKGIELAVNKGAKVISMSLGSDECQGGCSNCPDCRIIDKLSKEGIIFCVAASNSGPEDWTLGCPACAAGAITVGSVSMTDYPRPAYFSSRGPSNIANKGGAYELKPDFLAPGGGRAESHLMPDEVILSGEIGWMRGLYTGLPDPHGAMHGCILPDTIISSPDRLKLAGDLKPGDYIYSFNGHGLSIGTVTKIWDEGIRPVYKLRARNKQIIVTENHPLLVLERAKNNRHHYNYQLKWLQLKDMRKRDNALGLISIDKLPYAPTRIMGIGKARWLGYFIGDGWIHSTPYSMSLAKGIHDERNTYYLELTEKLFGFNLIEKAQYYRASNKNTCLWLKNLGLLKKAPEKTVPNIIFNLPSDEIRAFLQGYLDADGFTNSRGEWVFESASKLLIRGLAELCRRLGWKMSSLASRTRLIKAPNSKSADYHTSWYFEVVPRDEHWFGDKLSRSHPEEIFDINSLGIQHIRDIQYLGEEQVMDITVDGFHNFVGNGLLCHNTSQATPAIAGLSALLVEKGYNSADEIKKVFASKGHAKNIHSGYGVAKISWFS